MAKKRKSLATSLDEVDRTMHSTFCTAANSLSQLYSQAMAHQKLSFLSGERHGLGELELYVEEPSMTPRSLHQQQHSQASNPSPFTSSGPSNVPNGGDQQPRNYIFSNALSSPVRRSLQNYHVSHQNRDSVDSSMDINESTH